MKAFFAFDESLPTSATLSARDTIKIWRAQLPEILFHDSGPHHEHQNHHCDEDFVWQFKKAAFISNITNIGKDWFAKKMPWLTFTNMMLWVYLTTLAPRVVARLLQFIGLPSPCYTSATTWECQQSCLKIAHSTSISPHRDVKISQIWQEFSACPYQAWLILSPDTKSWILGPLPTPRTIIFPETVS